MLASATKDIPPIYFIVLTQLSPMYTGLTHSIQYHLAVALGSLPKYGVRFSDTNTEEWGSSNGVGKQGCI